MNIVDARGFECPKPVIMTKKALGEIGEGSIKTIVDNEVAKNNLEKLANSMGYDFSSQKISDEEFHTIITISEGAKENGQEGAILLFGQDKLGEDEELGKILIKSFIYTVKETNPHPKTMIFYNTGVKLTVEGSEVLEDLKALEDLGVRIISCGTCVDFFSIKEKVGVGEIGNMYLIYETMLSDGKVISIG